MSKIIIFMFNRIVLIFYKLIKFYKDSKILFLRLSKSRHFQGCRCLLDLSFLLFIKKILMFDHNRKNYFYNENMHNYENHSHYYQEDAIHYDRRNYFYQD